MRYELLGPLEVSDGGRPVEVSGGKQRALLAVLLLNANRVVSVDRLVGALWEDEPPETAAKAVQVYVSQLRKLLGKERLETRAPGYLLRVDADELDVERFRRLVEARAFSEALELWRGPPLGEFAELSFAQADIARLEGLRLACVEERAERDLAEGRHAEAVGELERLVREHPLRERMRAQLMLALYRSGRQAEALDAYQDARRALVEELGIEPGRVLRELHQRILNQDPSLDRAGLASGAVTAAGKGRGPHDSPPAPGSLPAPARETRKTVTVVCVSAAPAGDDLDPLDPETLRSLLGGCTAAVEGPVARHGGSVVAAAGGIWTAIFGIPVLHEDDSGRALRAALEIATNLETLDEGTGQSPAVSLRHGIGVSTGEVVDGGAMGPTGEPLARARRLAEASTSHVLVDDATYRRVRDVVRAQPVGGAYRVLASEEESGMSPRRHRSGMVGRVRERRRLHDAFAQALENVACQLFTVLGSPGVGKSRLVEEFIDEMGDAALVTRGRCLPYGEGITYWPLMEVVKEAVGLDDSDSSDEAIAKLEKTLGDEPGAEHAAERVAEMIGLSDAGVGVADGFEGVRTLVESLARERPLVVVFDDIHWGESTFLDLVEHLADSTRDVPLLLICLARPELLDVRPGWGGGKLNATSILLEPLSEIESDELIENLDAALEPATRERIVAAAEGNPLFVEEMLALMQESGGAAADVVVPPTIQALLGARVDRLHYEERTVIEAAAVVGKVFYVGAVAHLVSDPVRPRVPEVLDALVRKQLIRPERPSLGERTYRFRHILIRDAAYESIPRQARAEMHELFARWLEQAAGERSSEYEEVVGYHLEQAYGYRRAAGALEGAHASLARDAAERLGRAGRRAFVRSDGPGGVNLVSRAVALLPPEDPLRVELVPNVRAIQGLGDMTWADRVLTEAVEAAATTGDRRLAAHALVQRGLLRLFTAVDVTPQELLAASERAIAVFEEVDDRLGLARAWRLKAQAYYLERRAGDCADASEVAFEHIRRTPHLFEQREIVEWLAIALFLGPTPAQEAERRCERALANANGDPVQEAHLLGALAYLVAMQDRLDDATALLDRTRAIVEELGEWIWIVSWHAAAVARWLGDPAAAEREVRPAYIALKTIGEKSHFSTMAQGLAVARYMQGDYDEAERAIAECRDAVSPNDVYSHIMARSILGLILAHKGRIDEALALAREAVEFAAETDFYLGSADALLDLSHVLELAGDRVGAAAALGESIRYYELKGNVLAVQRARARLGTLT